MVTIIGVSGRWWLYARTFLYKIIRAWNFGCKEQVITEHRDCKWQVLPYVCDHTCHFPMCMSTKSCLWPTCQLDCSLACTSPVHLLKMDFVRKALRNLDSSISWTLAVYKWTGSVDARMEMLETPEVYKTARSVQELHKFVHG